jgi:hypothetical protein
MHALSSSRSEAAESNGSPPTSPEQAHATHDARTGIAAQERQVAQKEAIERKNAARVSGDTEGKQAAREDIRQASATPVGHGAPVTPELPPLMESWQRHTTTGKLVTVHRHDFTRNRQDGRA